MRPSRTLLLTTFALLIGTGGVPVSAQEMVVWEALEGTGPFDRNRARGVGFLSPEEGAVELVAVMGLRPHLWREDVRSWEELCTQSICAAETMAIRDSVIMTGQTAGPGSGGALSLDGGETWTFDVFSGSTGNNIDALLWSEHPDTDGSLYLGKTFLLYRSDDLGREGTYTELGLTGGLIEALAEVPPSAALPGGRLLAGVWNGLSYSDDGGATFQSSNVYQQGGLIATSVSVYRDPAHPYGAVAYAAVTLAGEDPPFSALHRSDDGGATWGEMVRVPPGDYGLTRPTYGEVLATSDGAVWYGVRDRTGDPDYGVILRSTDGGQTLEEAGTGYGRYTVWALAEAPDGRVYVASDSLVWRTVDPVVAVAEEPAPPESARLGLRVEPNPSRTRVVIRWHQAAPGAARVSVFDARGREILVLTDGPRPPGEQSAEVDISSLAPGVYLVRVVTEAGGASARLIVTR